MRGSMMAFLAVAAVACFGSNRSSLDDDDDDDDDWGDGLGVGGGSGDDAGDGGGDGGDEGGGSAGSDPVDADGDGSFSDEDCDDGNPNVHPGAQEICDADDVDEDCDGLSDDADDSVDAATMYTYWRDQDGDGYGDSAVEVQACDAPPGFVGNDGDCDDTNGELNPDNPCSGTWEGEYTGALIIDCISSWADYECEGEIWLEVDSEGAVSGEIACVIDDSWGSQELFFDVVGVMDSSGSIEGEMTEVQWELGSYEWTGVGLTGPTRIEGTLDDSRDETLLYSEFTATM